MTDSLLVTPFDRDMMQRCLQLARQALGKTAPNPLVGSVIVQGETIVGEGFHPQAGKPHAEIFALREAGAKAEGATVYVNLEPCSHYGRTPPCAEALIRAQVKKVIVGMVDPNPQVAGQGVAKLQAAGIEVMVGVEEADCQALNEAFVHRILYQRPFGILKYAMTLDGKIATSTGHSRWITTPESRHQVHILRSQCDAVIVGGNTLRQDNPYLTTHEVSDHNPLRVVMSRTLDLPTDRHLWEISEAPTVIYTGSSYNPKVYQALKGKGVEIKILSALTPSLVMADLYERGLSTVLWECGGILSAQAMSEGMIQKVIAFIAPKIIGGDGATSPVGNLGLNLMTEALHLERLTLERVGADLQIQGYLVETLPVTSRQGFQGTDV